MLNFQNIKGRIYKEKNRVAAFSLSDIWWCPIEIS